MAGEGSELPHHGMEELETMSDLGFVGSDDEADCKVIWEVEYSEGDAGAGAGRRSILVSDPVAFQDIAGKQISTRDEKVLIKVAEMPFSLAIQSEATKDIGNSDIGTQVACPTIKQPSYKAFYGSNKCAQRIGLGDSHDKLASSSSPQRVFMDNISDALSRKLRITSAKECTQFNQSKHQEQTSNENIESRSKPNKDATRGLTGKGSPVVKLGNQLEQCMVKALSAEPYHPVFPLSQGIGSHSLSSQQTTMVTSSGVTTFIGHPDKEMQVACQIAKGPSYGASYESSNPYQSTGLCKFHDKFAPSSFQGANTGSISNTLSEMNFVESAEDNTEYNRKKLQGQIDGYKNIDFGLGLNMDDSKGLDVRGGPLVISGMQVEECMVKALAALPYHPVFSVSQSANSSSSPQQPNMVNHMLQCMEYCPSVYCTCSPLQPTIEARDNSITPHVEKPYYQESFSLADNTHGSWGMEGGSNPNMSLLRPTAVPTKDYADIAEIYSTLDQQYVPKNIQMQFGPHVIKQSTHQYVRTSNYPNMQGEKAVEEIDFNKLDIQRKIGCHKNNTCRSLGTNSEFQSTPTLLRKKSFEFSQVNTSAIKGLTCSGSSSIKSGAHGDQYTMMNHGCPYKLVSGVVGASLPRSHLSSMIEGSSSRGSPNMINHGMGFISTYLPSPLAIKKIGLDEARKLELLIARLHKKRHGKSITSKSQVSCASDKPCVRRDSTEDFVKIIRLHEDFFQAYFYPGNIPTHIMVVLDQCYALAMEMESNWAPDTSTLRLAHQNESFGFKRYCVDFTQMHDPHKPSKDDFNATSFLRLLNYLSKGNHRLFHIKGRVLRFSVDQCGSRFIQQKLPTATHEEKAMVFEEIMPHVAELVIDVFGNYVVQKVMEDGTPFHKREIIECLIGSALNLSFHQYGCRVIQRAVEIGALDQKIQIAKQLQGSIMALIHDQNANHVIQKCIEQIPHQHIQFIRESMYGYVTKLSVHPYGCRVIQRILEHCHDLSMLEIFLYEIMDEVYRLAKDQYGNYVVQHILEHGSPYHRSLVIRTFAGRIITMSQQKFASNVVEKCLLCGSYEDKQMIINEILGTDGEPQALKVMVSNQYANYVVQKAIEICNEWQCKLMLKHLKAHHDELNPYPYARHIATRLERLIQAGENRRTIPRYSGD